MFNYILKVLYTGMQWLSLPIERDPDGKPEIHYTGVYKQFTRWTEDGSWANAFEAAGAIVEPVAPFTSRAMADGMDAFWRMRAWLEISALPVERQARVLPYIRHWAGGGAVLSGAQVFRGYSQMGALRDAAVAATKRFDFVLAPVSPVVSFPAELASPLDDPERPFEHIAFTLPFNMSEQPAASVNAGYSQTGLPIGLQLIGHGHDDLGVLRLARAWEQLRGPQRPWPMSA